MIRAVCIYNPASRKSPSPAMIDQLRSRFLAHGYSVEFHPTLRPFHAADLARSAAASSVDLVIACGGDGTIHEVVHGLVHSKVPLAILPSGTANVLARELGLPLNPLEAADRIPRLQPRRIALGQCGNDYFLLMAGVGLDALAIDRVNAFWKARIGRLAYWDSGFRSWLSGDFTPLSVLVDGEQYEATFIIVGRISRYGGSMRIAVHADLFTDRFGVCLFQGKSRLDYLRYLAGIVSGRHHTFRDVVCMTAHTIEVSSKKPVRFQLDGELKGSTPVKLEIIPDALTLLA